LTADASTIRIEIWPIERLRPYPRNPRKNDAAVDRMCDSIREFGFKIRCLVRGDGEIVDGHLRLKAAQKLGITEIPVILCEEWTPEWRTAPWNRRSGTKKGSRWSFRKSRRWISILSLTGFDTHEIDTFLALDDDEKANTAPPLPESPVSCVGDLWFLGDHRILCGDATSSEVVARLLGEREPRLMVTDPPYGKRVNKSLSLRAQHNPHLGRRTIIQFRTGLRSLDGGVWDEGGATGIRRGVGCTG
jgi:hypothetical protein